MNISELSFFAVFFICQKYFIIILEGLILILEGKEKNKFNENEWKNYFGKNVL